MTTVHMYTPFKDDSGVLYSMEIWERHVREVTLRVHFGELDGVPTDEVLFINGHGYPMLPYIGGTKDQRLNFGALGERLKDDGLRAGHRKIVIWSCYSGVGANMRMGFAYWLWHWMHTHGYDDLAVYAYTEVTVDPMYKDTKPVCVKIDPTIERGKKGWMTDLPGTAKDYRVKIAADGTVTGANPHPVDD